MQLPLYLPLLFLAIVLVTFAFLARAAKNNRLLLSILAGWIVLQTLLSLPGFYANFATIPPRMGLLVLPPLAGIVALLLTVKGRRFIDSLDAGTLLLMNTVRVAVELVLWQLAEAGVAPRLITFEGSNFDVLSGLAAPIVCWLHAKGSRFARAALLAWSVLGIALLANVVFHAVLAAPTPFQRYAFEAPFTAVGRFPFTLLPAFVVPAVALAHAALLRKALTSGGAGGGFHQLLVGKTSLHPSPDGLISPVHKKTAHATQRKTHTAAAAPNGQR